jgi:hypothetical protein
MRREPASGRRSGWHQRRPIRPAASTR